jgi:ribosomal protein S19
MIKFVFLRNSLYNLDRNMIILPHHVGETYLIHTGKEFVQLAVVKEMLYHKLGEFVKTKNTDTTKRQMKKKIKNRKKK